jgi:hypothetical protein
MIVINPGSENKGGTLEQATINAQHWLNCIHEDGFSEVEMSFVEKYADGNFLFRFTHLITKKVATLEIHGFTDEECKRFVFSPRVYWNGSSTAIQKIEDWLDEGWAYKVVYFKK